MAAYSPLQNVIGSAERPQTTPQGPWLCSAEQEFETAIELLEVHENKRGKMVFRVSEFYDGNIQLGECAVLSVADVKQVRDLLDKFLSEQESGNANSD